MAVGYLASSAAIVAEGTSATSPEAHAYDSLTTGTNRVLVVAVYYEQGSSQTDNVTAVTYNGVSMTEATEALPGGSNAAFPAISLWTLANPATGSNTVSVTLDEDGRDFAIVAAVFTGIDQSTVTGDVDENWNLTAQTLETDGFTTTGNNSMMVIAVTGGQSSRTPMAPAGTETELIDDATITGASGFAYWFGYEVAGAAGAQTVGASNDLSGDDDMTLAAVELLEAAAAGANYYGGLPLLGVGT